ncbi:MAG TPA: sulfite exporter TauE/SafE family protein [Symbiobacteriaceae bacterium]|nr:sulfite exporter TauE/SafE family protein [Symbiobacteriaceae bacterium]
MGQLVLVALIGLAAQLVDGSMGMAYGVTSSTLLLLAGFTPVTASASLHLAEVATTLSSGISHYRMGNVSLKLAAVLALPGAIGAFLGASVLGFVPGEVIKPVVAVVLFTLGVSILYRFTRNQLSAVTSNPLRSRFLAPLGFIGGLFDAIGGGGWGPIVTTTLLARGDATPRTVIGSVNFSESAVAVAATLGFWVALGLKGFAWQWVLALMAGGVVGAPVAAWLVSRIPKQVLGVVVGSVILLTNARTLVGWAGFGAMGTALVYMLLVAVSAMAFRKVLRRRLPVPASVTPLHRTAADSRAEQDEAEERHVGNLDG